MSEKDIQTHRMLVSETGLHKLSAEQLETIDKIGGNFSIEGEEAHDPDCTMNLPQLARGGK